MDTTGSGSPFLLHPFRALRLAHSHVGDPVSHRVFARPYRSVPGRLREWRNKRRLTLDSQPALYIHEYTSAGVSVRGIVALLDLADPDLEVVPHEAVHEEQVKQLAHRMEEMSLNPAPILLVHEGPEAIREIVTRTTRGEPHLVYTDRGDQLQRIWRITDHLSIEAVVAAASGTHVLIADGHHRFAAALRLHEQHPGTSWDRTLVMLIDEADTPLQLCAIHRTVRRLSLATVEERARASGDLVRRHATSHDALAKLGSALVLHDGHGWVTLAPREPQSLLVSWLHEHLLPDWEVEEDRLVFHHSASSAIDSAGQGVTVLLPAPTYAQVAGMAGAGRLLPQKATSFQPKPHLGVLMRELHDE